MTETDGPPKLPYCLRHEAIVALARAGHQVIPASPIFGGLWHVDNGPRLTDAQLIARARQTGFWRDDDSETEGPPSKSS